MLGWTPKLAVISLAAWTSCNIRYIVCHCMPLYAHSHRKLERDVRVEVSGSKKLTTVSTSTKENAGCWKPVKAAEIRPNTPSGHSGRLSSSRREKGTCTHNRKCKATPLRCGVPFSICCLGCLGCAYVVFAEPVQAAIGSVWQAMAVDHHNLPAHIHLMVCRVVAHQMWQSRFGFKTERTQTHDDPPDTLLLLVLHLLVSGQMVGNLHSSCQVPWKTPH